MKRIFAIILLAVFLLLPAASRCMSYTNPEYRISRYHVDIVVNSDNVYEITETIAADFLVPKHGIFREIPMRYEGQRVQINGISVNERFTQSKSGGNIVLKIGDPDVTIVGAREYVIKYKFNMGRDENEGFDLFYFNIIGTGWDTSISDVSFSITFPAFFDKEDVAFYTGAIGSSKTGDVYYEVTGLKVTGSIPYLGAGEGLTARIELPESAFAGESVNNTSIYISIGAWALCGILILFAFYIWNKKGRDPVLYPSVQFDPPDGMTPAEVGYVIDGIVDNKDITSLIFYWADKGYLDITESGKNEFLFIKKKDPVTTNYFESYMFTRLFSYGKDGWVSTNDLNQEFYKDIPIIKTQIKEKFEGEKRLFTKESELWSRILYFMSALPSVIMLFVIMGGLPSSDVIVPTIFMIGVILSSGEAAIQTMKKWSIFTRGRRIAKIIFFSMFIFLMTVAFFIFAFAMEDSYSFYYHSEGFIFAEAIRTALTTFIMFAFTAVTIKRTEYSHNKLEHLIGLKTFINEAEMDKLRQMIDDNPDYFYNILPYAIVLGLEKKWAGKMKGITMPPPNYYKTASGMPVSHALATGMILSCISRTGIVMATGKTSSGSGFSGGGFSGGGFGGGGGGSW